MLAGLVGALPCPDAGDELVADLAADLLAGEAGADLPAGDLLVAGVAERETAAAGIPAALVALPVSLLGSTDLAWGLAAA